MEEENQIKCPNCLSLVAADVDSCPHCKVEFFNCSNCHALVLETDTVCRNCNSKLDDEKVEPAERVTYNKKPLYEYKSLEIITNILIILLSAEILFAIINIYADVNDISFIKANIKSGGVLYYDNSSFESLLTSISQMLYGLIFIVAVIIYFIWVRQAYRNLHSLQLEPTEYSSGWAIGSYFVPILNLFRPYSMMKEIWFGSQPIQTDEYSYESDSHFGLPSTGFLQLWWGVFLIDGFASNISFRFGLNLETPQKILLSTWMDLISSITGIAVSIISIYLIWTINSWQLEKIKDKPKKYCKHCGKIVELDALLCNYCGKQLLGYD